MLPDSVFGRVRMGYLVFGSEHLESWKRLACDGIGMHLAEDTADTVALRMDAHARRLIIERNASEDLLATGWQVEDESSLQLILTRLARHHIQVEHVDSCEASARGVEELYRFTGPKGLSIELFTQPMMSGEALNMLCHGFTTGAMGMGHISMMSTQPQRLIAFWQELFDARVSDTIALPVGGRVALDVTFLRFNRRHHSVAIAATRGRPVDMFGKRIQHFNIEAQRLEDLSSAYERCDRMGFAFARGVGQHPNDRELSFYVKTPSSEIDMELGWDALLVDDEEGWDGRKIYSKMSTWGHDIPGRFSSEMQMRHIVRALRSLGKQEYVPW